MLAARSATLQSTAATLVDSVDLALRARRLAGAGRPERSRQVDAAAIVLGRACTDLRARSSLDGRKLWRLLGRRALPPSRRRLAVAPRLSFPVHRARGGAARRVRCPASPPLRRASSESPASASRPLGCWDSSDRLFTQLSGGERQRMHIARALLQLAVADSPAAAATVLLARRADGQSRPRASEHRAERGAAPSAGGTRRACHPTRPQSCGGLCRRVRADEPRAHRGPGTAGDVMRDELLSEVYGCPVRTNVTPRGGVPFVLPVAE